MEDIDKSLRGGGISGRLNKWFVNYIKNVLVSLLTGPLQFKFNKPTYPPSRMAWSDLIEGRSPSYEVRGGGGAC